VLSKAMGNVTLSNDHWSRVGAERARATATKPKLQISICKEEHRLEFIAPNAWERTFEVQVNLSDFSSGAFEIIDDGWVNWSRTSPDTLMSLVEQHIQRTYKYNNQISKSRSDSDHHIRCATKNERALGLPSENCRVEMEVDGYMRSLPWVYAKHSLSPPQAGEEKK